MLKSIKRCVLGSFAALTIWVADASAAGNDFGSIARNINDSVEEMPGVVATMSYLIGLFLGVVGVIKLKDHVENPSQTPMKEGAIRLAAGGALFGLPILFEAMLNTVGTTTANIEPPGLAGAKFKIR